MRASCLEKDRVAVPSFQTVVPQVDAVAMLSRGAGSLKRRSESVGITGRDCGNAHPPKFSPNVWPDCRMLAVAGRDRRPAPTETPVSSAHVAETVCGDAQPMPARNPRLPALFPTS